MRLFVCLRPPVEAVDHLLRALPPGTWPSERWHVTLAFLGEVHDPSPVEAALRQISSPPLALSLAGSGAFGQSVWTGVDGDVAGLRRLASAVQDACRAAGADVERRSYRPHLTVGRRSRVDPSALASYAGPAWTADEAELVRSTLGRAVEHRVLTRIRL